MRPPTIPTTIPENRDDSKQVVIMKSLYNSLIEYREPKSHRILIQLFMCLPSRKDFPEYFNIIAKPIAMNKIRERIERQQYKDVEDCMEDFKLMFSNCKFFNEDDSQIYKDAVILENILYKRNQNATSNNHISTIEQPSTVPKSTSNIDDNDSANNRIVNNNADSNTQQSDSTNHSTTDDQQNGNELAESSSMKAVNQNTTSNHHISDQPSTVPKSSSNINSNNNSNNNGIVNNVDTVTQQSDSTNHSTTDQQQNGNEQSEGSSIKINHNHHNEASMDSSSNLSADLLASTPVEKCSLNTRRGRNSDTPKRQLLTGYIIYASEIRKQVIDRNPNQNFGDISRLVGNEWKALPLDIRSRYDQRALIHNKRVRERAQRELHAVEGRLANGLHTPKLTKRKLAKLAKEQMRQHHLSISGHLSSSNDSPRINQEHPVVTQTPGSTFKHHHHHHPQPQSAPQASSGKSTTAESSTQTTAIRFVEPPTKKRLVYSDSFRKYIETLQVTNKDLLAEETTPERPPELPTHWLGAGVGRHESPEAALWALRDFMLQDAVTMRRSMEPYL